MQSYKTAIVPSSGGYIQVTNFSSSFTLPPQLYFGRFTFMAGCAHYSMRTHSDNETEAGLLVVESDIWVSKCSAGMSLGIALQHARIPSSAAHDSDDAAHAFSPSNLWLQPTRAVHPRSAVIPCPIMMLTHHDHMQAVWQEHECQHMLCCMCIMRGMSLADMHTVCAQEWANLQANIDAELDSAPGLVSDSLCLPACQDKVLGLDPHKPYQMLALNGNLNDTKLTVDWATYDAGAPGVSRCHNSVACCEACGCAAFMDYSACYEDATCC